jgi:NAD-dependent deacetylase
MKRIVVLTGAGISAESGIKTFRDSNGLWENHDVMEVASPQGWEKNRALVLQFYNARRKQLKEVAPNAAHKALAELESKYSVIIITQNVDDLHERGGSSNILHLHGELTKMRSVMDDTLIYDCPGDINVGDKAADGYQLRPHIVWFGEMVPMLEDAALETSHADIILVIGSSMQVYPAAGLVDYAPDNTPVYYIDPKPALNYELKRSKNLTVIAEKATVGVPKLVEELLNAAS